MTLFKVYLDTITEYEVIKETPNQIIYVNTTGREIRENKTTTYWSWHNTKDGAKAKMIVDCKNKIESYENRIRYEIERGST